MLRIQKDIPHVQMPENSHMCGAACLKMLYDSYGIDQALPEIWKAVKGIDPNTGRENCRTFNLALHPHKFGLFSVAVSVGSSPTAFIDRCLEWDLDIIFLYRPHIESPLAHFSVITGVSYKGYSINDPELPAASGKNKIMKPNDLTQSMRPISSGEILAPNTFVLVGKPGTSTIPCVARRSPLLAPEEIQLFPPLVDLCEKGQLHVLSSVEDVWLSSISSISSSQPDTNPTPPAP